MSRLGYWRPDRQPVSHLVAVLVSLSCALALAIAAAAPVAAEPDPPSGTIGPGDPPVTWTGGNISGVSPTLDEASCVDSLNNCETFTLTLGAGDYAGVLTIEIAWSGTSDYDLFVHEGDLNGPLVASATNSAATPYDRVTIHLDPGPHAERIFAIHVVAIAVPPGSNYSGSASLTLAHPLTLNVEIDWLEADGHSHRPSVCELEAVKAAFAAKGHILNFELSDGIPEDAFNTVIDFTAGQGFDAASGDWASLESAYRDHGAGWHYCIFGHSFSINGVPTTSSGYAELPGDEFLVALGLSMGQIGTPFERSGVFMHELGHNLSLRHAGGQNEGTVAQWKPNFPSVMAYRYTFIGVKTGLICEGLATTAGAAGFNDLDYSSGTLAGLDENALCESEGLGLGTGVDWSCAGGISDCESPVTVDLSSGDDWCTNTGTRSTLTDYNDWANIVDVSGNDQVMSVPQEVVSCLTAEEAAATYDVLTCTQPDPCDQVTAILVALRLAEVEAGAVRLVWYSGNGSGTAATVYRAGADGAWSPLGAGSFDGNGELTFVDRTVTLGRRYGYRLRLLEDGGESFHGEAWVEVPGPSELALSGPRSNPLVGDLSVTFTLPTARPARLALFDVAGRRLLSREVGSLGAGSHTVSFADGVPAGVYLLSLTQDGRSVTKRFTVMR
jgi:hypothetical protein